MTKIFLTILSLSLLSLTSFAGSHIKPYSCHPQGEITAYCNCEFLSRTSGRQEFKGQVLCSILKCNDYTPQSAPDVCSQGAKAVTCNLSNPGYAGLCQQTFPIVESEQSAQALCDDVLGCLNNVMCVANYCRNSTIRQGWNLHSVQVEESSVR